MWGQDVIGNVAVADLIERTETDAADYTDPAQQIHEITKPTETRVAWVTRPPYNNPSPNNAYRPILVFRGTCSFHTIRTGSSSIRTSITRCEIPIATQS